MVFEMFFSTLPVILAAVFHMFVVKWNWFEKLSYPLDHYKTYNNKRILGDNKTYRGIFVMVASSVFFTFCFELLVRYFSSLQKWSLLDFSSHHFAFYGFLFGFGYTIAELPNSFYKRQKNVLPGKTDSFLSKLIDQTDSVLLILILLFFFARFTLLHCLVGIVFFTLLHALVNYILFLLKVRKEPF